MTITARVTDIKAAWSRRRDTDLADPTQIEHARVILGELARGRPVTLARAAELLGIDEQTVNEAFDQAAEMGAELDENGAMVGNALTLNPTDHRFRVNGNDLFAWCSLDTLFLPGLIGQSASVESKDPVSGETVSLEVGPEGVRSYQPSTAVVSVVIPGETPSCDVDARTGPTSPTCTQMNFFATKSTAETWAARHPGVAIVSIEEADEVARQFVDDPCGDCC